MINLINHVSVNTLTTGQMINQMIIILRIVYPIE